MFICINDQFHFIYRNSGILTSLDYGNNTFLPPYGLSSVFLKLGRSFHYIKQCTRCLNMDSNLKPITYANNTLTTGIS